MLMDTMKRKSAIWAMMVILMVGLVIGLVFGKVDEITFSGASSICLFCVLSFYVFRTVMGFEIGTRKILTMILIWTVLRNGVILNSLDLSLALICLILLIAVLHSVSKSSDPSLKIRPAASWTAQILIGSLLIFWLFIPWGSFRSCAKSSELIPEITFQGFKILGILAKAGSIRAFDLPVAILLAVALQASWIYFIRMEKRRRWRFYWMPAISMICAGLWVLAGTLDLKFYVTRNYGNIVNACIKVRGGLIHSVGFPTEQEGICDIDRETPLQTAVRVGNRTVYRELLRKTDKKSLPKNLLELAAYHHQVEALAFLIKKGVNTGDLTKVLTYVAYMKDPEGIRLLLANGYPVHGFPGKSPPLLAAVRWHNLEVVNVLLEHGADPNGTRKLKNGMSSSPVLTAARISARRSDTAIIKLLVKYGGKIDSSTDYNGKTAIDYAREGGFEELVKRSIETAASDVPRLPAGSD